MIILLHYSILRAFDIFHVNWKANSESKSKNGISKRDSVRTEEVRSFSKAGMMFGTEIRHQRSRGMKDSRNALDTTLTSDYMGQSSEI